MRMGDFSPDTDRSNLYFQIKLKNKPRQRSASVFVLNIIDFRPIYNGSAF